MKKTIGRIALLLVFSMMVGLVAGCDKAPPASTTVDPKKPIVLRLATGNTDSIKVMNDIAATYAKDNPTVSLEITVIPGGVAGFNAAMASKFAANDAPDLFQYQWGTQITAYARAGQVMDLTKIGVKELLKDIKKPVNTFEGKDYAYPLVQGLWGLMYNSEIGKKAGVTDIPKTLAQFTAAMDKIKAGGQQYPFIVPAKDGSGATGFVFCYLHQVVSGQNPDFYYEILKGTKSWSGPEWKGLFDTYKTLLTYASPDSLGLDPDNALARFARGEGTFLVTGPSTVKRIEGMNPALVGKILYIPFPLYKTEAEYGTIADYDSAFSIWSKTKYPEHAIGMFKAFYTSANSVAFATVMNSSTLR